MSNNQNISQWLNHLRVITPPTGIILIGAGSGDGEWPLLINSWDQSNVTMIEADEHRYLQLKQVFNLREDWRFENQIIAKEKASTDYYFVSNSAESSLLDPKAMREIWPNISLRNKKKLVTLTLDDLEESNSLESNWMIIDCLPGLPVLYGAKKILEDIELVVARCVLNPVGEQLKDLASQQQLEAYFSSHGFRRLTIQKERHASIGHALYIRDPHKLIDELRVTGSVTQQQLKKTSDQLKRANDFSTQMKNQIEKVNHEKVATEQQISEVLRNLKDSNKDREKLKNKVNELEIQLEKPEKKYKATKISQRNCIKSTKNDYLDTNRGLGNNLKKPTKFSSDANLDDFLNDIRPFLYGKSITYVDIGAFVGEVLLKLHQSNAIKIREAHLYEPNPDSYTRLKNNINGCDIYSLHTYNMSISNIPGEAQFSAAKSMTKKIRVPLDQDKTTNTFTVDACPLDQLDQIMTDRRIDMLKIDVEGEELDVLKSASSMLEDQRIDIIYIEAGLNKNGTQQTYFSEIDMFMQKRNYRIFKIYEQVNEWVGDSPLLRRCNIAYMSLKFADANPFKASKEIERLKKELANLKLLNKTSVDTCTVD